MTSPRSAPGHGRAGGMAGEQQAGAAGTRPGDYAAGEDAASRRLTGSLAAAAWPAVLAGGLACLVLGIVLVAWPSATLTVVAIIIGIALILAGVQQLARGFTGRDTSGGHRVAAVIVGLLAIVVGLLAIRHYNLTIGVLAIVVGLFWVINGIADIAVGLVGEPPSGRALTMLAGVLSLAAGLIVLFWPAISAYVLAVVIGIWLIVYGVILIAMALGLRRAGRAALDVPGPRSRVAG